MNGSDLWLSSDLSVAQTPGTYSTDGADKTMRRVNTRTTRTQVWNKARDQILRIINDGQRVCCQCHNTWEDTQKKYLKVPELSNASAIAEVGHIYGH